jgi:hypothetical protein
MVLPDQDAVRLAGRCIGALDVSRSSGSLEFGVGKPVADKRAFALTGSFQSKERCKGALLLQLPPFPLVAKLDTLSVRSIERQREVFAHECVFFSVHQGPSMESRVEGARSAKSPTPSISTTSGECIPYELHSGFMGALADPRGSSFRGYNYQASSNGESVTGASRHLILQEASQSAARADPWLERQAICEGP